MEASQFECTRQSGGVRTCFGTLQTVTTDDTRETAICPDCGNRYRLPELAEFVALHGYAEDRRPKAVPVMPVSEAGDGFVVIHGVRYEAVAGDDTVMVQVEPESDPEPLDEE